MEKRMWRLSQTHGSVNNISTVAGNADNGSTV